MSSNLWIIDSFVCGPFKTSFTFKSLSIITVTGRVSGISIPNSNFENHILKLPFISDDELEEKGKL